MKEFKWVWSLMRKYRLIFFTALGLVFVVNLLNMINPYVQGMIVDRVIVDGQIGILLTLVLIRSQYYPEGCSQIHISLYV